MVPASLVVPLAISTGSTREAALESLGRMVKAKHLIFILENWILGAERAYTSSALLLYYSALLQEQFMNCPTVFQQSFFDSHFYNR